MSKDAYYFSHDSNAKDDPKCVLLIEQLGAEGYGIFWILIETLRDQPDYKYPLKLIPAISRRYNTTAEKMKTVVMQYGLFQIENDEFFFSESLNRRMESFEHRKQIASYAGKKSASIRALSLGVPDEEESSLNQVYVIRCYNGEEEFIKIGATSGKISRRFSGKIPYQYEVLRQIFAENELPIEQELQEAFGKFKYVPQISFPGSMECFSISIKDVALELEPQNTFSHERRFNVASTLNKIRGDKKRVNKSKEYIEIFSSYSSNNSDLFKALNDFAEMRKSINKPLSTERAAQMLLTKLDGITSDSKIKIAILEQSTFHNWQSVFPLKGEIDGRFTNNSGNNVKGSSGSTEEIPKYGEIY